MKIKIKSETIKNLSLFASKDKARYILNGVYFATVADRLEIAATDGRALLTINRAYKADETSAGSPLILLLPKGLKTKGDVFIDADCGIKGGALLSWLDGKEERHAIASIIEGTFPNYRQVIPTSDTPAAEGFAWFSSDVIKKIETLGMNNIHPTAKTPKTPHCWKTLQHDGTIVTAVAMPLPL